ncbi:hypothetical protein BDV28DRAFT_129490 [Aspergillus coremiiformis]|uniref:Uncharacterized protein n=1 Tax=Aspergillus coremiiformis TaxID=138285 RepID=A0A5N6ZGF1_9EURO|nr:hypothetical protein BDV28DRAFT_129490 [Aspergillus coremiiformis]
MQSSKNDPADQQRRLRSATKNQTDASRSADAKPQEADMTSQWRPEEFFETGIDKNGNPVPDPVAFTDGAKMQRGSQAQDEADLVDAANDDFDDFD